MLELDETISDVDGDGYDGGADVEDSRVCVDAKVSKCVVTSCVVLVEIGVLVVEVVLFGKVAAVDDEDCIFGEVGKLATEDEKVADE